MTDFPSARNRMVDSQLRARHIADPRVLEAMLRVPRERFVLESYRAEAYEDHPLPIGNGQTISQPYIVAVMLELLELTVSDTVLEVGTGSGYATALLAELAAQVFSIERCERLAEGARHVLNELVCRNVKVFTGDGTFGLPEYAPFDAILVSAAASHLPPALLSQLSDGGRMVVPVGPPDAQQLQVVQKENGQFRISLHESVRFVPLIQSGG